MKPKCHIVDTTLRDGEQSAGIAFSKEDKVNLALQMDEIGLYQIEVGIPALGISEQEAIQEIMARKKQAIISAWSNLEKESIKAALICKPDILHVSVPVSYAYVYSRLKKNKQWVRGQVIETVNYAKEYGQEITIGFEDASRADISFIISLCTLLQDMGVKRIRYADTVGVMTPHNIGQVIRNIKAYSNLEIEIHAHNDFGMAIANSLEAIKSGAQYVDCTFMGIGERAGNCDFLKFVKATDDLFELNLDKTQLCEVRDQVLQVIKGNRM